MPGAAIRSQTDGNRVRPDSGGVVCASVRRRCRVADCGARAIKCLRWLAQEPLQTVERLQVDPATTTQLEQTADIFVRYVAEQDLKTTPFLGAYARVENTVVKGVTLAVKTDTMEEVVSLCKRRGFVYPSSEIYGGFESFWDYGPLGIALKRNVREAWWHNTVRTRENVVGVETGVIMNPNVWQTTGHASHFADTLVECTSCHQRFRVDHLEGDACPNCDGEFTEPRRFLTMFKTHVGPVEDDSAVAFMRPGDRAGHVRQLQERAQFVAAAAALRHRPDRQVVPQRDYDRQFHLPPA